MRDDPVALPGVEAPDRLLCRVDDAVLGVAGPTSDSRVFGRSELSMVRRWAGEWARAAGCDTDRVDDVVLVVNEAASNAIEHGGGRGTIRAWTDRGSLVIEVCSPAGPPLAVDAGLVRPDPLGRRGRGLWLMRQLTDHLEIDDGLPGSTVRMHLRM